MKPKGLLRKARPVALALWAALAAGFTSGAAGAENGQVVSLRTLGGEPVQVSRRGDRIRLPGIQGRAVLVNFWATWCEPCREEVPELIHLFKKYRSRGLVVLGISFDTSMYKLNKFVEEYRVPYPIWIGNKALVRSWTIRGLPGSYLMDGEGKILKKYLGTRTEAAFGKDLEEFLAPAEQERPAKK